MAPETTRERLEAIDDHLEALDAQLEAHVAKLNARQDEHSGKMSELQILSAQQAVMTRAIQTAISASVDAVAGSARWIRRTCGVVAVCAIVAAGVIVYRLLR